MRRPAITTLTVLLTGVLAALALGPVAGAAPAGHPDRRATSPCEKACYEQKSTAYQQCRAISPRNRDQRRACFQKADAQLAACLKKCR